MDFLRTSAPLAVALVLLPFGLMAGCGSGSSSSSTGTPAIAPGITSQPANQTVPLAQQASFSVGATGSAPFTYEWKENGIAISGAALAELTTAPVTLADNGALFTVTVSNSAGSVTSKPATLSIGPRSVKAGDLRFKFLGQTPTALLSGNISAANPGLLGRASDLDAIGSPLEVGQAEGLCTSDTCGWLIGFFSPPVGSAGLEAVFSAGDLPSVKSDIDALLLPGVVITALDEQPSKNVYAISYNEIGPSGNQPAGFSGSFNSVAASQLQEAAAQAGSEGRVITAVTYDQETGNADYIAYGWQSDPSTVYETKVMLSSYTSVEGDAAALAASGFIITATGTGPAGGFILIGTRVQGDTLARPFASVAYPNALLNEAIPVARLFDSNGNSLLAEF